MGGFSKYKSSGFIPCALGLDEYHKDPKKADPRRCQTCSNIHIDGGVTKIRPGMRLWGPSFDNLFRGVHEYIDTDGTARLLVVNNYNLFEVDSSTKTSRDTFAADEETHIHTHREKAWINSDAVQRKLSGTTASDVGLAAPTTAPVAASNGAGGLTGNYAWKVTYVIESGGVKEYESDPSGVSNSLTSLSSNAAQLTIPTSSDTRVNARYLYRSTDGGAKYYYEGKVSDNTTTTFDSDAVTDAQLGNEVETNHYQPVQGEISEGANERLFWIVGSKLYHSEIGITDAYMEYQVYSSDLARVTSYHELPNNGVGKGLKALYNPQYNREDLIVFQEDSISILPAGDPNQPLLTVSRDIGCKQHDSIVQYNDGLVFLSNKKSVMYLTGGRLINISARSIPTTMGAGLDQGKCRGALVFDHYYAITMRNDRGKLYNHKTMVCDLRTINEVQRGQADAIWFQWDIDAEYLIQRADGTVLAFDSLTKRIYQLSFEYKTDEAVGGTLSPITWSRRTMNIMGDSLFVRKQPRYMSIWGPFERQFYVIPIAFQSDVRAWVQFDPVEAAAVMGQYVMGGAPTTTFYDELEAGMPSDFVGNTFSFEFRGSNEDYRFEFRGFQFTYNSYQRAIV